jgi:regulatory protein SWI6
MDGNFSRAPGLVRSATSIKHEVDELAASGQRASYISSTATQPDVTVPQSPQLSYSTGGNHPPSFAASSMVTSVLSPAPQNFLVTPRPPGERGGLPSLSASPQVAEADPASVTKLSDGLYTATYSGIPVFEMMVNGVAVMRRKHDSSLNATQILKVAGVEKSKRTKVLEKEILTGIHEKVQGGYGKYQGTWIPYDRAVDLCKQYSVYDLVEPLLKFDPSNIGMENTPTKEQALAAKRKQSSSSSGYAQSHQNSLSGGGSFNVPLQVSASGRTPLSSSASAALNALGKGGPYGSPDATDSLQQRGIEQDEVGGREAKRPKIIPDLLDDDNVPSTQVALAPLPSGTPNFETSRDLVTQIFLDSADNDLSGLLGGKEHLEMIQIDVPIDDYGHTALHWACALARVPLVKELVKSGANILRGNYAGETPLIRAVLVTNNSDYSTFPQLLDILYPAIPLIDNQGRTILHQIALTAGIKGRSDASRYYLESLLEWIVRRGSHSKSGKLSLGRFMSDIVNIQDKNGDTALNIAARVGNKNIAQQLLEVGADVAISNRAGLRPVDFGVRVLADAVPGTSGNREKPIASQLPKPSSASATEKGNTILSKVKDTVSGLGKDFEDELANKQRLIDSMHSQLRQATVELRETQEKLTQRKSLSAQLVRWQQSSQNLERAVEEEDRRFKQAENLANGGNVSPLLSFGFEGNFDADQPFRVWMDSDEVKAGKLLPSLLNARIAAYRRNESQLKDLANELRGRSTELERKFRKVVSLCTGVSEDQVDNLLSGLVQAVESDSGDVDISRVAGFLRKVDDGMVT